MALHGVALVDKPEGMSSFSVVSRIRRVFRELGVSKAGHTGTLDPLATGLLPICLGEATKYSQRLLDADKGYLATVKLGSATTTGDREGEVVATALVLPVAMTMECIESALATFRGIISQTPPIYSALKVNGKAAYEYARAGQAVELAPREVTIHQLRLLAIRAEAQELDIEVICSKGTYIRSLAEDLAKALGTVGHLQALRRTQTGGFHLADARPLEQWMDASDAERLAWLLPTDRLLADLPEIRLDASEARDLRNGKCLVQRSHPEREQLLRAYDDAQVFLGLAAVDRKGVLRAERLLSTQAALQAPQ